VTKDIMEDYDMALYTQPDWYGDPSFKDTIFELPLSYFGYDPATFDPDAVNYVIGTLKGGKREYNGVELTLQKLRSNHWQGLVSYTYNDAKGNSNSDGNADFQGDTPELDPRAPGLWGKQPGNIEHQFKMAGSYYTNFGLEAGLVFNWNSGVRYSRTYLTSGRDLPLTVDDPYEFGGYTFAWVADDSVGTQKAPSYYTLDARVQYEHNVGFGKVELHLDIFNVLNKQSTIQEQDLVAGGTSGAFGEGISWVAPRAMFLGATYSF
jgi:hypothetical protein